MPKPICLFIGRFQPYHLGHHMVIQGMTKVCKKVIIGIGSSQESGTSDNPYSAQERKEMIQEALQDENIIPMFDIEFMELPDDNDDARWAQHILEKTGHVDMIWTGNEWTKRCFQGKVEIKDIKEVPGIDSTSIRDMIRKGDERWKGKVTGAVVYAIQEIGTDRVR